MRKEILNIVNLSKSFGGLKLFEGVNITLEQGTINALFGGNGTGKTTIFNIIGGYEKLDAGTIRFNNLIINNHTEFEIAKAGIGKMWQEPTVFPNHSVLQNLLVSDKVHPGEYFMNYLFNNKVIKKREIELKEKAMGFLQKFKLGNKGKQLAGSLSLGEKKLLSISMLLMNDAQLILLDEPFSNVNPDTIERISIAMDELRTAGKTVFMIEHKRKFAEVVSNCLFMIENFKIERVN